MIEQIIDNTPPPPVREIYNYIKLESVENLGAENPTAKNKTSVKMTSNVADTVRYIQVVCLATNYTSYMIKLNAGEK